MRLREPQIHSHITDVLPDDHPLAWDGAHCVTCGELLHALNNECMQTWVETGEGNFCLECWIDALRATGDRAAEFRFSVLDNRWGLAEEAAE